MVFSILRVIDSLFWIDILSWENDREVGPHFTHFGEGGQGVLEGYEGTGRYYFFSYL